MHSARPFERWWVSSAFVRGQDGCHDQPRDRGELGVARHHHAPAEARVSMEAVAWERRPDILVYSLHLGGSQHLSKVRKPFPLLLREAVSAPTVLGG